MECTIFASSLSDYFLVESPLNILILGEKKNIVLNLKKLNVRIKQCYISEIRNTVPEK